MAFSLTELCYLARDLNRAEKVVFSRICDRASDDPSKKNYLIMYASQNRIAWETSYSRRSVTAAIKSLNKKGLINIKKRNSDLGKYPSNIYTINLNRLKYLAQKGEVELEEAKQNDYQIIDFNNKVLELKPFNKRS